jgi:2-dehydropantoate 2-reductase
MDAGKPARYVIAGAGAIGIAVGGLLERSGSRVKLLARPAFQAALATGVTIRLEEGEFVYVAEAVASCSEIKPEPGDVVLLTTKSQATEALAGDLASVFDRMTPVVCLQNAIRNEEIVSRRFARVYAGLVFMSAVQLVPELITVPGRRTVAVGIYPSGVDGISQSICSDFSRAGIEAVASRYVMAMKWGKLIANLNNATHAITGYWLERGSTDPEMRSLMAEVREEGLRVLDAAGIAVEPPKGEPSPVPIRKMTEALKQGAKVAENPESLPVEKRTYASMWQDLRLGRRSHEAEFLNGEIVEIGKRVGIATPYNSTLLGVIDRMFDERLDPGIYTPAELKRLVKARAGSV